MNFYVLSLKHSPVEGSALWWGPSDCGYTQDVNRAGVYTEEQIKAHPDYYDNGASTKAIPCECVKALLSRVEWKACQSLVNPQ